MPAELLLVDRLAPDPAVLAYAADLLRRGKLVAFPTETVYGLGALALNSQAVERIFAAKGRPPSNPLIVHVPDLQSAERVALEIPEQAKVLADAFWPGPLSLVLASQAHVPLLVRAGLPSVAVRVPAHPVALALLRTVEEPIAAPSANQFMRVSPTRAQHVMDQLGDVIDLVLDAGPCDVGIESTVLDVRSMPPTLLRPGMVTREALERVIGRVDMSGPTHDDAPRHSPGMLERHYSPRASLYSFSDVTAERAREMLQSLRAAGRRTRVFVRHTSLAMDAATRLLPSNAAAFATRLYDELNALDADQIDVAFLEEVPNAPEWRAIEDRLTRAGVRPVNF